MKIVAARAVALLLAAGLSGCASMRDAGTWVGLIDGAKGIENWERSGEGNWRAEGDSILADRGKGNSYLISRNAYADFQLRAEFWVDAATNSGILIRLSDRSDIRPDNSYEVNIFDDRPDPSFGTGAVVGFAKVSPMPRAGGRWNTLVITARGDHIVVELNGEKSADLRDAKFARGPIALQYGPGASGTPTGAIKWRKVQIRAL